MLWAKYADQYLDMMVGPCGPIRLKATRRGLRSVGPVAVHSGASLRAVVVYPLGKVRGITHPTADIPGPSLTRAAILVHLYRPNPEAGGTDAR